MLGICCGISQVLVLIFFMLCEVFQVQTQVERLLLFRAISRCFPKITITFSNQNRIQVTKVSVTALFIVFYIFQEEEGRGELMCSHTWFMQNIQQNVIILCENRILVTNLTSLNIIILFTNKLVINIIFIHML